VHTLSVVATFLLVPPVNLLLLSLLGFVLWRHRAGHILCAVGLAGLLLLALPISGRLLALAIEAVPPPPAAPAPAAIVILSADARPLGDAAATVGPLTLERERAGAALARTSGLPVLVSGGVIPPLRQSLATLMADSLEQDFATPVRWQEADSGDTWENARYSAALLAAEGIRSVFLVTHAWHMRRALIAFRHFGIVARPAPVPFSPNLRLRPGDFVPSTRGWADSYYALHEWLGCAWYALRASRS
jgi:uncharacterized SAM-binding protein YcdF (DUF218 family)